MLYFFLFVFSIILFIYNKKKIPYYLFPLSLLFDLSLGFVEASQITNTFQPSLFIATTLIFARSHLKRLTNINFFLFYLFLLLVVYLVTVEIRFSAIRMFTVIFVCYYMYYVGYNMAYEKKSLYYLNQSVLSLLVICIIFYILAQVLSLERFLIVTYQYSDITADLGTLGAQTIHTLSLSAILFFVLNYYVTSKATIIDHIILSLSMFIIFIVFRRTAILLLLVGLSTFILLSGKKKSVRILLFFVPVLVFVFTINFADLSNQFEHRLLTKMNTFEDIQRENRILEYQHYFGDFLSDITLKEFFFGNNSFFETRDFGRTFYRKERPIHTDYIFILYSAGLVGLLLLLSIYYSFFLKFKKVTTVKPSIEYYLKNVAIALLFTNIIVMSLGGGFRHITYVSFLMFNVGFIQNWLVINGKKSTSLLTGE